MPGQIGDRHAGGINLQILDDGPGVFVQVFARQFHQLGTAG